VNGLRRGFNIVIRIRRHEGCCVIGEEGDKRKGKSYIVWWRDESPTFQI
jgi:hypothetical protein